jgi:hypothetical protein
MSVNLQWKLFINISVARRQWLMPVILATQEADQVDHGLKPAQANSSWDPISKNPSQKRTSGVSQGVDCEFKPQYHKKQNQNQKTLFKLNNYSLVLTHLQMILF